MPRKSFGQTLNHVYVGGLKDFVRAWKDPSGVGKLIIISVLAAYAVGNIAGALIALGSVGH